MNDSHPRVDLAGIVVDLMDEPTAINALTTRSPRQPPVAVISANLDHIVQFGREGRWRRTLGDSLRPTHTAVDGRSRQLEWLTLLDGAPVVAQADRLTGRSWPRLAGSDLIGPLLDAAEKAGLTVGFLGGSYLVQRLLSRQLIRTRPGLVVAGMWSPDRSELAQEEASLQLAATIAAAGPDLLIVCLGKPRQELWISTYGPATGASVLLAFGAVVDFLADAVQRAPAVASAHGLEWAWRLAREPRRLAKRYLLDDPPGLVQMRRHSALLPADPTEAAAVFAPDRTFTAGRPAGVPAAPPSSSDRSRVAGQFVPPGRHADVAVLVVTFNNEDHLGRLLASLRREAEGLHIRVVVADNDSTDGTVAELNRYPDVVQVQTGGNLGYAAGINAARRKSGDAEAVLVLNPDLEVVPGAINEMLAVLRAGTAHVVVPRILDTNGNLTTSLRREPSLASVFGDALFGGHWPQRPSFLAETDAAPESYQFGHEVDWATGAAVMVRSDTERLVGDWDERFFLYSEETDYFRRARDLGARVWFEPNATMVHAEGGSGNSVRLQALMTVNRVRYIRKHHTETVAEAFRAGVILHEALRSYQRPHRRTLAIVADEARWETLPGPTATRYPAKVLAGFPRGAVIIPAHNEAAVITLTLRALEPVLRTGRVEVIVVCNGCTDNTAELAAAVPGVQVLDCPQPSKTAAMNLGDAHATQWPRVYLDADTVITPITLRLLLERLQSTDNPVLAARPSFRYDDAGANRAVRAYYRARRRLPSTKERLWGAGVFGMTREGHERFGAFPDVTADDYYVDQQFLDHEKAIVPAPPVPVRTPQDIRSLAKVLRRGHRGPAELREAPAAAGVLVSGPDVGQSAPAPMTSTASSTTWELVRSVRGPFSMVDALSYSSFAAAPRLSRLRPNSTTARVTWERDDSSRNGDPLPGP
ncbi:WecB/TagA/CpsF family glycosyltransferase [Microbacterium sp. A93]|uniref:WecB/TagA/CpsF family glycosyltransferase n=1 Tax=Microbacterium sp. A93 TaxID=3450716 RepID=UPI003F43C205